MTYKQFNKWCNARCEDGKWGLKQALECGRICHWIDGYPWYKRERVWKANQDQLKPIIDYIEHGPLQL